MGTQPDSGKAIPQQSASRESTPVVSSWLSRRHWPIALLLLFGLVVGGLIVKSYGVSTDEFIEAKVGADALQAYRGSTDYYRDQALGEHGPIYFMIFSATSRALTRIFPLWLEPDGRHMTNYLAFLVGVYCFYVICLNLMRRSSALVATALFATQPLLFGSAFINQKDIPFMTLFMAVVALGLKTGMNGKALGHAGTDVRWKDLVAHLRLFENGLRDDWRALGGRRQAGVVFGSVVALFVLVDLFFLGVLRHVGETTVVAAFNGRAPWPLQAIYALVASDAYKTPLRLYLEKYDSLFTTLRLALAGTLIAVGFVAYGLSFPTLRELWRSNWSKERQLTLVAGAIVLGATICVRQVGIFAGGLVSLYLLYRDGAKAIVPLFFYWAIAGIVTFVTWPYLWADPLGRIAGSFQVAQNFRAHGVLFQGQHFLSSNLPRSYLPSLIGLELTESALVLACLGLGVMASRFWKMKVDRLVVGLLGLWLLVPVAWQISRQVSIYNNLRHFYFVLPPIFIFAGAGIDAIQVRVRHFWARWLLLGVTIAPSVFGLVRLHPYQYIYFNSLAGGVSGAYGEFDLDYWCTSVKEATEAANAIPVTIERLLIFGPVQTAIPYARSGLKVVPSSSNLSRAGIVVVCARFAEPWDKTGFRLAYQVKRSGAILAEVWRREDGEGSTSPTPAHGEAGVYVSQ